MRFKPMLATLIDAPFDDKEWVFETKWDGYRIVAEIEKSRVKLFSRNGIDETARYPTLVKALSKIKRGAIIDGELVALDSRGRSRFELLQRALQKKVQLQYCAFDLLYLDGKDMRSVPLVLRKARLHTILPKSALIHFSRHVIKNGKAEFAKAKKQKLEGIIGKRAMGKYYSGKRTREWVKIKAGHQQEAVIVGFTKPRRSRKHFGALVLAVRSGAGWKYAGHVGTGFDGAALKSIHEKLHTLKTSKKPLKGKIKDESLTTWVRPALVGEISFTEWTSNGEMRHPAFLGLRHDKSPKEVIKERA